MPKARDAKGGPTLLSQTLAPKPAGDALVGLLPSSGSSGKQGVKATAQGRSAAGVAGGADASPSSPSEAEGIATQAKRGPAKAKPDTEEGLKSEKGELKTSFALILAKIQEEQTDKAGEPQAKRRVKNLAGKTIGIALKGLEAAKSLPRQGPSLESLIEKAGAEKGSKIQEKAQKLAGTEKGKAAERIESAFPPEKERKTSLESLEATVKEIGRAFVSQESAPPHREAKAASKSAREEGQDPGLLLTRKPAKVEPKDKAPELTVTDLRKPAARKVEAKESDATALAPASSSAVEGKKSVELDLAIDRSGSVSATGGRESFQGESPKAVASPVSRDFSTVLAEQLKETWNKDIVSSAHIVLKDGDAGTIRLRLHPESLGGVKIELNLADNNISGKIIVESDAAKSAFEKNMAQLQDAFKQGGFESARLEVQVGSGNSGGSGGGEEAAKPFWSERRGLASLAEAVPDSSGYGSARGRSALDILA